MSRKTNKNKRVNKTQEQLLSKEWDKNQRNKSTKQVNKTREEFTPPPYPVSGARVETLDDINAFLSGSTVEETVTPPGDDIPAGNALLLTVADLCALLQISRTTLFRMEKAGKVPGRLSLGGQVRYHRETVETWLRSQLKE